MMMSSSEVERVALDEVESKLRPLGYTVVRAPIPDQLPPFLNDVQPDAIAIGPQPSLLIEVFRKEGRAAADKVNRLRARLQGHDDWDLQVFYYSSLEPSLGAVDEKTVEDSVDRVRRLKEAEPSASYLLAWAVLEAVARDRLSEADSRPLSPHSIVSLLMTEGVVSQKVGARLFELAGQRNHLAHGQLDLVPTTDDIEQVLDAVESLRRLTVN